jgi:glycosyltransferase involved in cell wall biosynthesis
MRALKSGRLNHAYWFIHEDTEQIALTARDLTEENEVSPIIKLANEQKLTLVVPSNKVMRDYKDLWKTNSVAVLPLNVDVPDKYKKLRSASDYSKLNFLLSGTPADSRKGQLLAMSAFYSFLKDYYEKFPGKYRDFSLSLVSIGDDYVSQQIKSAGKLLGNRLKIYPSLPYEESLDITSKCNAVICCSINETFALYVAEGMYMGHVLLRNDSAGMEEQLKDGVNGFYIDTKDVRQFVKSIEKLLNKKLTDDSLKTMGEASKKIITPYAKNS